MTARTHHVDQSLLLGDAIQSGTHYEKWKNNDTQDLYYYNTSSSKVKGSITLSLQGRNPGSIVAAKDGLVHHLFRS
jgi:hypothetical protein